MKTLIIKAAPNKGSFTHAISERYSENN